MSLLFLGVLSQVLTAPKPEKTVSYSPQIRGNTLYSRSYNTNHSELTLIQNTKDDTYLIDINSCPKEELESLPGIGTRLAARIIAYRNENSFKRKEDIMFVPGIGIKKYDKIKDIIKAGI